MIKSFFWFAYDILFSILICSAIGLIIMEYLVDFQRYWLAFFCLIFLVSGYYIILFSKNKNRLYKSLVADLESADSRFDFNLTYSPLFCFVISFGLINQQLFMLNEEFYTITLVNEWPFDESFNMFFYAYDNFIRAACLDLFETFNLHISPVGTNNVWIMTLNFCFKTFLSIFFIKALIEIFKTLKKYKLYQAKN